jgi:hypothetical protein
MTQKLILTRLGAISSAKILGVMYMIIGLIIAVPLVIISALDGSSAEVFGFEMIIIIPLLYGAIGAIGGILMAVPYNIVAKKIGGIEYEAEAVPE